MRFITSLSLLGAVAGALVSPCARAAHPRSRASVVRMGDEMDFYKKRDEEKGQWSIFAPKPGEEKPDPPWLAKAKERSDERAKLREEGMDMTFKSPYAAAAEAKAAKQKSASPAVDGDAEVVYKDRPKKPGEQMQMPVMPSWPWSKKSREARRAAADGPADAADAAPSEK